MSEELKPTKERRVAIAAYNGCLKAKRNEFCLSCVVEATGYDGKVTGDRRSTPHDYTRSTPDTSAVALVRELRDALRDAKGDWEVIAKADKWLEGVK